MVYYSQKYADKQKRDRAKIIMKAKDLINHPEKYSKATSYGVAGYVNNLKFVKSTGEIADGCDLSINEKRIEEEEKYDGYYSIVTSEEHLSDVQIRDIYRGLAKIEETFKVTKSGIESRPVWVSRKDRIESHFLTCFIALVLIRLIEKRLNNEYPFNGIIQSIRDYTSTNIEHDLYIQSFRNDVINAFEKEFNIELSKKYKTLSEIRKILK
jgi:transposase